jgi:diacylglycerol kinase family enzyme
MRRRFLLVHNPTAGIAGRGLASRVVKELEARGATIAPAPPGDRGPELSRLDLEGFDAAIAAGGDGTFRSLARVLGTRLPIGFLPLGTGNVLAAEVGLPRKAEALAHVLLEGPATEIEGARANGEPFFLMAGAGFDGDVIARLDTSLKRRVGKAAYVAPVLAALATDRGGLEVEVDGRRHEAGWVVVAKARCYGGAFVLAPAAGLTKSGLQAILFKSRSRAVRMRQLLALASGLLARDPSVETISCRRVSITSRRPLPVEIDGDPFQSTPLTIEAGGPKARLIVPAGYVGTQA